MPKHPHVGEGERLGLGFAAAVLAGDPSRSLPARPLGGIIAPALLLAYAIRWEHPIF